MQNKKKEGKEKNEKTFGSFRNLNCSLSIELKRKKIKKEKEKNKKKFYK